MSEWLICERGHLVESDPLAATGGDRHFSPCASCGGPLRVALDGEVATVSTADRNLSASIDSTLNLDGNAAVAGAVDATRKLLGDYELLEEIGLGGMGVVYRARQRSANRIVALKVIRPDRIQRNEEDLAIALARFRTEAQAAARLTHDHIVTIYDVGQLDGAPYYSMQYIDGHSLSAILRTETLEPQRAAKYLEAVARAVHEAHLSGVLHRDLKPANILIDSRTERPMVTDFGLAKIIAEGSDLTVAGQVFGSPPYMSPEQARDSSQATAASDTYSLGATLYCALTGRPPFQALTTAETLRQLMEADAVPPRRLNARIDLDLETICLKCLEKDAARRYSSAQALADDLGRYLRHEPIVARPVGRTARLVRWCRRKPAATLAIGSVVSLLIAVLAFIAIGRLRDEQAKKDTAFLSAQADTGFREALSAYDKLVFEVQERLGDAPGTRQTRRELLETALSGMNKVMAEHGDATARLRAATLIRMGDIAVELGDNNAAQQDFSQAALLLDGELVKSPSDTQAQRDLSVAYEKLGYVLQRRGDAASAREYLQRCYKLRLKLGKNTLQAQRDMAIAHYNLGRTAFAMADWNLAKDQLQQAIRWLKSADSGMPSRPDVQHDLALYLSALGDIELQRGDLAASETAYRESVTGAKSFAASPEHSAIRESYASSLRLLGDVQRVQGKWAAAQVSYAQARQVAEELQRADPDAVNVQWLLAITTQRVGLTEHYLSEGESLTGLQQGIELLTPLAARAPSDTVKVGELALTHDVLAGTLQKAGDLDDAHRHAIAAQSLRAQLALQRTDNPTERMDAGRGYVQLAATAESDNRYAHALDGYRRALEYFRRSDNQILLAKDDEYKRLMRDLPSAIALCEAQSETEGSEPSHGALK